jgi:hypothetical protein
MSNVLNDLNVWNDLNGPVPGSNRSSSSRRSSSLQMPELLKT